MQYCLRNCGWCVIQCTLTNSVQQPVCSAPSVFPTKIRRSEVAVMLKIKLKRPILREFPGYWWLFKTQHLLHHGIRLFKEERKKNMNNSDFQPFQVCHFKVVITHCYYYRRLRQAQAAWCTCTFRRKHLFPGDDITLKTLLHWMEPPFWNRAIPT